MFKKTMTVLVMSSLLFAGVSTTNNKMPLYSCNSVTTAFTFDFPIINTTDIKVVKVTVATGAETTLTKDVDYTVSATNNDYSSGGTITTTSAYTSSYQILLIRNTPLTQGTDLITDSGVLRTQTLVDTVDKQMMIAQDNREQLSRCLKIAESDPNTQLVTLGNAVTRANKYLAFNSAGDLVPTAGTTSIVVNSTFGDSLFGTASAATAQVILGLLDENNMISDSNAYPPSQQSVKAYVDSGTVTMTNKTLTSPKATDPNITGTVIGGATYTSPTLTTPTLTSPVINTGVSGTAIDTNSVLLANSDTKIASQKAVKSYVDSRKLYTSSITQVFSSTATTGDTYQTLDLTAQGVGANALVFLKVKASAAVSMAFRYKGAEAVGVSALDSAADDGSASTVIIQTANYTGYAMIQSDASGDVEWAAGNNTATITITLMGYIN